MWLLWTSYRLTRVSRRGGAVRDTPHLGSRKASRRLDLSRVQSGIYRMGVVLSSGFAFDSGVGYADYVGDGYGEADGEGEAAEFYLPEVGGADGAHYVAV